METNLSSFSSHLSDSLALDGELLHLGEVVVECHHVRDDGLLVRVLCEHICETKPVKSQPERSFDLFFSTRLINMSVSSVRGWGWGGGGGSLAFGVQQLGDVELLLGYIEGALEVVGRV